MACQVIIYKLYTVNYKLSTLQEAVNLVELLSEV